MQTTMPGDAGLRAPVEHAMRTCAKCGMTAMAFICSERGCPENGGAAYPWTIYPEKPDSCRREKDRTQPGDRDGAAGGEGEPPR